MFSWFSQIADTVKYIGQKANDAWTYIGDKVKPFVKTVTDIGRVASSVIRNTDIIPYSDKISNFIDKGMDGLDWLTVSYDKADEFKNNLAARVNDSVRRKQVVPDPPQTPSSFPSTPANNATTQRYGRGESVSS